MVIRTNTLLKQLRSEGTALLPPAGSSPLELALTEAKAGPFNLWLTKTNSIVRLMSSAAFDPDKLGCMTCLNRARLCLSLYPNSNN